MAILDALLPEFDHEIATTRRVLERVPEAQFTWKPHEKSMSLGELSGHVANLPLWCTITLDGTSLDLATLERNQPPTTQAGLLKSFDDRVSTARARLAAASNPEFFVPWTLKHGDQEFFTMPRISVLRTFVMNHLIHHRGQLTVYLRLNNVPVPAIYGPTADEPLGRMSPVQGFLRPYALCVLPFLVLATMNSAGYRFGASDQAFYAPAMLKAIDPALYPRDAPLIRSQARLTLADDVIGPIARATALPLPALFAALQIVTLGLLAAAGLLIARTFYRSTWAAIALLALLTIRHAISKSGTNTLEGYFHPRQLAFALGALALAAVLRGRGLAAAALVAAAFTVHPTTALWFAIWLGVAAVVNERHNPHVRKYGAIVGIVALAGAVWALTAGPLAGRLERMDAEWLATLSSKDYLFPLAWPVTAWAVNLGYIPVIVWLYRRRRAAGAAVAGEAGLVFGCLSLAAIFVALLPFNQARVALAIQLQPARVFWMLDLLTAIYVVWAIAEDRSASIARARATAIVLILLSVARGSYGMFVTFPERTMTRAGLPDDDWGRTMAWARASAAGSGWLAHPEHAARYGTSVRVAGQRDVFVESIKDAAVGMYDRAIAMRTRDRVRALGDFDTLTPERARALAAEFDLDYLVAEQVLDLPQAFASGRLRVYLLR